MRWMIIFLISFGTRVGATEITQVTSGDAISALKMNEVIAKINQIVQENTTLAEKVASLEKKILPVGSVVNSLLTLNQFQSKNGDCWRLMDGSSIVGTELATISGSTTVPDAMNEGVFLRQAKNGRALGSYEADTFQSHNHKVYHTTSSGTIAASRTPSEPGNGAVWSQEFTRNNSATDIYAAEEVANGANGTPRVGSETRPKNIAVNMFIKVKEVCNFN